MRPPINTPDFNRVIGSMIAADYQRTSHVKTLRIDIADVIRRLRRSDKELAKLCLNYLYYVGMPTKWQEPFRD